MENFNKVSSVREAMRRLASCCSCCFHEVYVGLTVKDGEPSTKINITWEAWVEPSIWPYKDKLVLEGGEAVSNGTI